MWYDNNNKLSKCSSMAFTFGSTSTTPAPAPNPPAASTTSTFSSANPTAANTTAGGATTTQAGTKKRKRKLCTRCDRPLATCICSALPQRPIISLQNCRIVVLQHPHEKRRKNRSLPIVELCFSSSTKNENHDSEESLLTSDFHCIVARRLGDQINSMLMNMIQNPNDHLFLFYPSDDAIPLQTALERIKNQEKDQHDAKSKDQNKNNNNNNYQESHAKIKKITLLFIDATWKYAKEMIQSCLENNTLPPHTMYVKLTKEDFGQSFQQKRFDIRKPPSESHLSTAECIAHALRIVEGREGNENNENDDDNIFDVLMKPLDLMVAQWHSFIDEKKKKIEE